MSRPVVIGIAGGIGSGKSTVARAMAEDGALLYDADSAVADLYRDARVLDELASWWGADVVHEGGLDRARVADIIFADPAQRARLEGLLFPMLAQARSDLYDRAEREGVPAVVVDAPLLFEAGLDTECDVVVFVDTPGDERLVRLRGRSGWDAGELDRREQAQLPLADKRARSRYTLGGAGSVADVATRARALLRQIIRTHATG